MVSNLPTWITDLGAFSGIGPATVTLVAAPNSGAPLSATVLIAGVSVTITQPGAPAIYLGGIVNAASYAAGKPLAPSSIAAAYGSFLLTTPYSASGAPLPTSLAGLSLQFGSGTQAPLFFADVGQINFQIPWEFAGQSQSSLTAALNGQAGAGQPLSLASFSPGLFATNSQGSGQGAILNSAYALVNSLNPAIAGNTVVQIYCTGLGAVTNQPATGSSSSNNPLSITTTIPSVTIGGAQATVLFSGLAPGFVGTYQVNALVPAAPTKGSEVVVAISIGGVASNTVTIAVQ
jgi:minor extracellular serine protease Vpr